MELDSKHPHSERHSEGHEGDWHHRTGLSAPPLGVGSLQWLVNLMQRPLIGARWSPSSVSGVKVRRKQLLRSTAVSQSLVSEVCASGEEVRGPLIPRQFRNQNARLLLCIVQCVRTKPILLGASAWQQPTQPVSTNTCIGQGDGGGGEGLWERGPMLKGTEGWPVRV